MEILSCSPRLMQATADGPHARRIHRRGSDGPQNMAKTLQKHAKTGETMVKPLPTSNSMSGTVKSDQAASPGARIAAPPRSLELKMGGEFVMGDDGMWEGWSMGFAGLQCLETGAWHP